MAMLSAIHIKNMQPEKQALLHEVFTFLIEFYIIHDHALH